MVPDPKIYTYVAFYFQREIWPLEALSAAQLEVTPWSEAGKGHLAFQPTGTHWDRTGSAEALGELRDAIPKRAAPFDQPAAQPQRLDFGEEVTAAADPVVFGGGGGTRSDNVVLVAGQFVPVQQWLDQQGVTARVNIDRDLAAGLGDSFWGHEEEESPVTAAAGHPLASEEGCSGSEESVVTVRGSADPPLARAGQIIRSPAGLLDTPRPGGGVAGEKAPQRRSKVG